MNSRTVPTHNPMQCNRCHSHDTSTFEMAHLRGSQSGRISGTVYGYDGDVEWHSGTMQIQSHLAQVTAPPVCPAFWSSMMRLGFVLSILSAIVSGISISWFNAAFPSLASFAPLGKDPFYHRSYITFSEIYFLVPPAVFFLGLIVFAKLRNPSYKRERRAFKNQMRDWQNSVICLRCGNAWLI